MIQQLLLWTVAMIAPFGTWKSCVTTDVLTQDCVSFSEMKSDGDKVYWTEIHPQEKGRAVLVKYGKKETFLLPEHSVRTYVHEYGGGSFFCDKKGLIFSNAADNQLYRLSKNGKIKQLTEAKDCRFADGHGAVWVCEKHGETVENCLVLVKKNELVTIASGHDFYSSPRVSPDGKQLAYLTWDFPNMPWDGSTLWLADIDKEGQLVNTKSISGGENESICQIQWSKKGALYFVSDKTGFGNLYRYKKDNIENLCPMEAEFGMPAWVFGKPTYAELSSGKILCAYTVKGIDHLGLLDPKTKTLKDLNQPFTYIQNIVAVGKKAYFFGGSPSAPLSVVCYNSEKNTAKVCKSSCQTQLEEPWISKASLIEYPVGNDQVGYAFYYPPCNPHFKAKEGDLPPLLVKAHGGPTARSYSFLSLEIQFWTSRGFAFLDVNYGGSTGFGRDYLKRLEGNWGIVDVADCSNAAKVVIEQGLADPDKLFIRGGSAGGFTALSAVAKSPLFLGATSYFGVSDLELLYEDTHKFESRYTDRLVAPYPEGKALIYERSPIHNVDKIQSAVLLLQGTEDKIVPPNQSVRMYEVLKQRKSPVAILLFEKEGHGFKMADNIKRALDAELYFYAKLMQIDLPEPFKIAPVDF